MQNFNKQQTQQKVPLAEAKGLVGANSKLRNGVASDNAQSSTDHKGTDSAFGKAVDLFGAAGQKSPCPSFGDRTPAAYTGDNCASPAKTTLSAKSSPTGDLSEIPESSQWGGSGIDGPMEIKSPILSPTSDVKSQCSNKACPDKECAGSPCPSLGSRTPASGSKSPLASPARSPGLDEIPDSSQWGGPGIDGPVQIKSPILSPTSDAKSQCSNKACPDKECAGSPCPSLGSRTPASGSKSPSASPSKSPGLDEIPDSSQWGGPGIDGPVEIKSPTLSPTTDAKSQCFNKACPDKECAGSPCPSLGSRTPASGSKSPSASPSKSPGLDEIPDSSQWGGSGIDGPVEIRSPTLSPTTDAKSQCFNKACPDKECAGSPCPSLGSHTPASSLKSPSASPAKSSGPGGIPGSSKWGRPEIDGPVEIKSPLLSPTSDVKAQCFYEARPNKECAGSPCPSLGSRTPASGSKSPSASPARSPGLDEVPDSSQWGGPGIDGPLQIKSPILSPTTDAKSQCSNNACPDKECAGSSCPSLGSRTPASGSKSPSASPSKSPGLDEIPDSSQWGGPGIDGPVQIKSPILSPTSDAKSQCSNKACPDRECMGSPCPSFGFRTPAPYGDDQCQGNEKTSAAVHASSGKKEGHVSGFYTPLGSPCASFGERTPAPYEEKSKESS